TSLEANDGTGEGPVQDRYLDPCPAAECGKCPGYQPIGHPRPSPCVSWPAEAPGSAPAELRRDVPQDAVEDVRVVVDAELVRHGEQQGVRGRHGLVLGQLLDQLVRLAGVGLPEAGDAPVDVADLVTAGRVVAEVRAVEVAHEREDAPAHGHARLARVAGRGP